MKLDATVFQISRKKCLRHANICCCSVTKSCPTFCDPVGCSTPGSPVLHYLLEFAQTHVHWANDAFPAPHPPHPLLPSSLSLNLSSIAVFSTELAVGIRWSTTGKTTALTIQTFVAKVLELQFQHQSFQWIFRVDWFDLLAVQGTLKSLL